MQNVCKIRIVMDIVIARVNIIYIITPMLEEKIVIDNFLDLSLYIQSSKSRKVLFMIIYSDIVTQLLIIFIDTQNI